MLYKNILKTHYQEQRANINKHNALKNTKNTHTGQPLDVKVMYYMKADLKKRVFRYFLKQSTECGGKRFQSLGARTEKEQSPLVLRLACGIARRCKQELGPGVPYK